MIRAYHLRHGGVSRYEKIKRFEDMIHGSPPSDRTVADLASRFSGCVVDAVVACAEIPGAGEALNALNGHFDMFVASGTPEDELREIVKRRGLSDLFAGVFGSPKSKSAIITAILAERNLRADETIMIGDAMTDYTAARQTGIGFIGVCHGVEAPFPSGTQVVADLRPLPRMLGHAGLVDGPTMAGR